MKRMLGIAAFALVLCGVAAAQQGTQQQPGASASAADMKMCQDAMAQHEQMMKDVQAMDDQLQQQIAALQTARGEAKVDAVARVVTTMAEQRRQLNQRMMAMHAQAMSHMMSHMGQGAAAMQQCPMMQHMMKGDAQHQH